MLILLSAAIPTPGSPRPPEPSVPSLGLLFNEGFNQPYGFRKDATIDSAVWTESWSGWSLNRQGDVVQPWVVPMVVSNSFRVDPERGAIRFWYRPDYGSETGPGKVATLLTLVSGKAGNEATWWSLVVTPDGKEIHLLCQTGGGAESCMKVEINWTAGGWHLLTLGFTPTNSAIFVDDRQAAVGDGLPTVPKEAWPFTSLFLGSTLSGADSAMGQIEELGTFTGRKKLLMLTEHEFGLMEALDVVGYYSGLSGVAASGPMTAEEAAALAKQQAETKALQEAGGETGGGMMMRMMTPLSVCVTNSPSYITNTTAVYVTNQGWTVTFDVQGTNSPVDIFMATNLSGTNIAGAQWVWLEQGPSCATYQYTNQLVSQSYYVLGTMKDSDGDTLTDAYELLVSKTSPNNADTDGDGMPDGWEVTNGLNPLLNDAGDDPDGDWLTNYQEYNGGTNSTNPRDWMVVAWGLNTYGQCNVPADLRNVKAIAAGYMFSAALLNDGTVRAWGANDAGQTNVPTGLTNALSISADIRHAVAVRSNGTVSIWGSWLNLIDYAVTQPADLTNVVLVAAGQNHDLALRSNGVVTAWGAASGSNYMTIPTNVISPKSLAAGVSHSVALLSNGTVAAWGENYGGWNWNVTNVPASLSNVASIAAGDYHTLALKSDGTVTAWGNGSGNGLYFDFGQSIVPASATNVTAVVAAGYHSMALRQDGSVVAWGDMSAPGYLNSNIVAIATGLGHGLGLRTGRQIPLILQQPSDQVELPGTNVTFTAQGLGLAGVRYQWQFNGTNIAGQTNATLTVNNISTNNEGNYTVVISTGAGSVTSSIATLVLVTPPVITNIYPSAIGAHTVAVESSQLNSANYYVMATAPGVAKYPLQYQWFKNGVAQSGKTNSTLILPPNWRPYVWETNSLNGDYSVKVWNPVGTNQAGPWTLTVASIPPAGAAVGWGANSDGQVNYPTNLTDAISIAAGATHSVAARENGNVVQWGHNWASVPGDLTNAVAVSAGAQHTVALRNNGTVICWGTNTLGQTNTPAGLTNVMAVAAGGNQSLALRKDGSVTNWGQEFATKPASATNVIAIACGTNFNMALKSNATVVAWGNNSNGQTNVPSGLSNVVAIAAGGSHALALKVDGTVVAWGLNANGQTNVPAGLSNVMAVAAGNEHSVALKNDGSMVAWGKNTSGQTNVPPLFANAKLIAAGGDHTLAAIYSSLVQYSVDVTKDLLLIYNATSTNSTVVKDYYLAHRPLVSGANTLGIGGPTNDIYLPDGYTTNLAAPVSSWLAANPTKRPQYVILFSDIPERINTNIPVGTFEGVRPSVSYRLHTDFTGWRPFVNHIHMGDTNTVKAYIDKLEFIGTNYSPGQLFISASAGGYGNTNYYFDDTAFLFGGNAAGLSGVAGVIQNGASTNSTAYTNVYPDCGSLACHITTGTNVAGYLSWGGHSSLGNQYATNGFVKWTANSAWWIIATVESFNGQRDNSNSNQGNFLQWFSANAFGGTNYSNTPVGAATHVEEPGFLANDPRIFYGLWQAGKSFGICAWNSTSANIIQFIGDPLVKR